MPAGPRFREMHAGKLWKNSRKLWTALRRMGTDGGQDACLDHTGDVRFGSLHIVDIFDLLLQTYAAECEGDGRRMWRQSGKDLLENISVCSAGRRNPAPDPKDWDPGGYDPCKMVGF